MINLEQMMPALYRKKSDDAYNRRSDLLRGMDTSPILPMDITPDKKTALILLGGQVLSGLLGANTDVVGSYTQGRQYKAERDLQSRQAERNAVNQKLSAEIDLLGQDAERFDRRAELMTRDLAARRDDLDRQKKEREVSLDRLADNYRMAKSPGQLSAARSALNEMAMAMGREEFIVDDNAFQADLSALGSQALKMYSDESGRIADRYGMIPENYIGYFEARRKQLANDYFGGDAQMVPEVYSTETLKAKQFNFHMAEVNKKFSFMKEKERTRIAEAKANLDLKKQMLAVARRNAATAEDREDIARQKLDLEQAEFEYKKSLPKEAEVDGELKSIDNQLRQKRIAQHGTADKDKRQVLEQEIKGLQQYKNDLIRTKKELAPIQFIETKPFTQNSSDTRIVGNTGKTRGQLLQDARAAIAQNPAIRDQVIARLRGWGVSEIP